MRGLLRALRGPLLKRLEKSRDGLCCYFDLDEADRELYSVVWPKLTSFDSVNLFPNSPCGQIQLTRQLEVGDDPTRCLNLLRAEPTEICRIYARWDALEAIRPLRPKKRKEWVNTRELSFAFGWVNAENMRPRESPPGFVGISVWSCSPAINDPQYRQGLFERFVAAIGGAEQFRWEQKYGIPLPKPTGDWRVDYGTMDSIGPRRCDCYCAFSVDILELLAKQLLDTLPKTVEDGELVVDLTQVGYERLRSQLNDFSSGGLWGVKTPLNLTKEARDVVQGKGPQGRFFERIPLVRWVERYVVIGETFERIVNFHADLIGSEAGYCLELFNDDKDGALLGERALIFPGLEFTAPSSA